MPFYNHKGSKLYYKKGGSGPKLLFCNASATTIASTRDLLNKLAEKFELICFDYRGMGLSAPQTDAYTMADIAGDVLSLLDLIGWEKAVVAGWSFGGMVAQELAISHPDRIDRLALLSTSPGGAYPSFGLDRIGNLTSNVRGGRSLQLIDQRWTTEWLSKHPVDASALGMLAGFGASESTSGTQVYGMQLQLKARMGHDVVDRLSRIYCPTFVAHGRHDLISPPLNGQAIVDRIAGSSLHIYEGGHAFFLQDPNAWSDIAAFLNQCDSECADSDR